MHRGGLSVRPCDGGNADGAVRPLVEAQSGQRQRPAAVRHTRPARLQAAGRRALAHDGRSAVPQGGRHEGMPVNPRSGKGKEHFPGQQLAGVVLQAGDLQVRHGTDCAAGQHRSQPHPPSSPAECAAWRRPARSVPKKTRSGTPAGSISLGPGFWRYAKPLPRG